MSCRSLLAFALALLLAACASPLSLKPGTPIEEARSTLGRPTTELGLPDGGTRLQFSGQPNNQSVVNADFDAQGRLLGLGAPLPTLGEPFQTSGCPDCNRPFYNEQPAGPLYNYPWPLSPAEAERALAVYSDACPAYQSIKGCSECSWTADIAES